MTTRALFICGSLNQTTQLHEIARELPEVEAAFTPYYCDAPLQWARRAGLLEFTILGFKLRRRCLAYLDEHGLPVDLEGRAGGYDLVVTCSDLVVPRNTRGLRTVVVQEGILDPFDWTFAVWRRLRWLPPYLTGTAATGLSGRYERFCVASEGYRDLFVGNGAPPERVVVTGIPNFDDCRRFRRTLPAPRVRPGLLVGRPRDVQAGRPARLPAPLPHAGRRPPAVREAAPERGRAAGHPRSARSCPSARVFAEGSAEEMIANCAVLVTQYSSTAFVGLALGKEVHSYYGADELRRLLPVQNGCAARNIAAVCRDVLARPVAEAAALPALARVIR